MLDIVNLGALLEKVVGTKDADQYPDANNRDEVVSLDSVTYYPPSRPEALVLLFSYSNVKGADPGFKNLKTRKKRTEQKKPDEAVAASAHLVILLQQKSRKKHSYFPALIEDVEGLGKTKMQHAITGMIGAKQHFSFKNEDGHTKPAFARFEMLGLDDEQVEEDAAGGALSYFVAIRELREARSFDDELDVKITREEVKLKPKEKIEGDGSIKAWLKKLAKSAHDQDYDKVRVHYQRKDGKNRSITFGTHREDAEDFLIKRIDKIELKTIVAQTHDVPCTELVKAMVAHLRK
ncbi:MAG: hypothetical protein WC617_13550 [Rhodanobacter sp.]|jgi:hypothetical protein